MERAWFDDFSALDVQCTKPADRATVLHAIRCTWGSEDLSEQRRACSMDGIDEFNKFVRKELPEVFKESKARYSKLVGWAASEAIELALGAQ